MDAETLIAFRKARQSHRSAWKGTRNGLSTALPTDTHSASSNVVFIAAYRPVSGEDMSDHESVGTYDRYRYGMINR